MYIQDQQQQQRWYYKPSHNNFMVAVGHGS
jgi:hypothetical protein